MNISIEELVNKIKSIFDTTKVLSVDTIYEKISNSDELRLVISINKILYDDINIIYTKFIFTTDNMKSKLTKNYFTYLHDINCEYIRIDFSNLDDFENKIKSIFKEKKFGENIKILSDFIKSPATLINKWFENNEISDISIINIDEPKISIMPCKLLYFNFKLSLSNNQNVDLTITKNNDAEYNFKFEVFKKTYEDNKSDLNTLVETIGENLKKYIK